MHISGYIPDSFFGLSDRVEPRAQGEKTPKRKNECLKTRDKSDPYEIWVSRDGKWRWHVLKKNQIDDNKPYAIWFCFVTSPYCPEGEYGDTYVKDVKTGNTKL